MVFIDIAHFCSM